MSRVANLKPTAILDCQHPSVRQLAQDLRGRRVEDRAFLTIAHTYLVHAVRPVYSVDEWQRASTTLQKQRGSCSQRLACLEALARTCGIGTRARALRIAGSFWFPPFPYVRRLIPPEILLVWPQFFLAGSWVDFDEIYTPLVPQSGQAHEPFTNRGESLFDAVAHTAVDFFGKTKAEGRERSPCDLSSFVLADEGFFDTRDEVFVRFGSFQRTWRGRAFELIFGGRKSR
jgi:hypothetical protein